MPRTIFPNQSVNKPLNLAKSESMVNDICIGGIPTDYIQRIDRIKLSVNSLCYDICKISFDATFGCTPVRITKGKIIYNYIFNESQIQIVKYPHKKQYDGYWFEISIHDPGESALKAVINIIEDALVENELSSNNVSLTQAEFAMDIKPLNPDRLYELKNIISDSIILKYSRASSHNIYKETTYLGKGGNVRKGSKGIRCYLKNDFFRVELQTNRPFNRYYDINIYNIFTVLDNISLLYYFDLYKNINDKTINKIVDKIITKKRPNIKNTLSKLGQRAFRSSIHSYVVKGILASIDIVRSDLNPVSRQMDHIKKVHSFYNITYHKNRLFQKLELE